MTEKKKNSLTDAQKFALRDWLIEQEKNGITYANMTELTKAAQAAHDFPITACNMYNLQSSANVFLIQQKQKKVSEFADLEEIKAKLNTLDMVQAMLVQQVTDVVQTLVASGVLPEKPIRLNGVNNAN